MENSYIVIIYNSQGLIIVKERSLDNYDCIYRNRYIIDLSKSINQNEVLN